MEVLSLETRNDFFSELRYGYPGCLNFISTTLCCFKHPDLLVCDEEVKPLEFHIGKCFIVS